VVCDVTAEPAALVKQLEDSQVFVFRVQSCVRSSLEPKFQISNQRGSWGTLVFWQVFSKLNPQLVGPINAAIG
jgi:hypothetical protein